MNPTADMASRPHSGYRHEAFFFADDDEFLEAATPFVRVGVDGGEPTLVALRPARLALLRAELGAAADGVLFVDIGQVGANPARLLPTLRGFLDQAGADPGSGDHRPVRCLGEPIWPGRRAAEVAECQLHEALLNMAVEPDAPVWLRCCYDVGALSAEVTETARHSHPVLVDVADYRGSTSYEGLHHVHTLLGARLPEPDEVPTSLRFAADGLRAVRALVRETATSVGLGADRVADLEVATYEVARNSIRHGGGAGQLRIWVEPDALVCEVTDPGRIENPLVGRLAPEPLGDAGRGLWLAHNLADLVQVRSSATGTTVRISAWR